MEEIIENEKLRLLKILENDRSQLENEIKKYESIRYLNKPRELLEYERDLEKVNVEMESINEKFDKVKKYVQEIARLENDIPNREKEIKEYQEQKDKYLKILQDEKEKKGSSAVIKSLSDIIVHYINEISEAQKETEKMQEEKEVLKGTIDKELSSYKLSYGDLLKNVLTQDQETPTSEEPRQETSTPEETGRKTQLKSGNIKISVGREVVIKLGDRKFNVPEILLKQKVGRLNENEKMAIILSTMNENDKKILEQTNVNESEIKKHLDQFDDAIIYALQRVHEESRRIPLRF